MIAIETGGGVNIEHEWDDLHFFLICSLSACVLSCWSSSPSNGCTFSLFPSLPSSEPNQFRIEMGSEGSLSDCGGVVCILRPRSCIDLRVSKEESVDAEDMDKVRL